MRVIPNNFTGFICGQWHNGCETLEAVMFYEDGKQSTMFVPHSDKDTAKLYRALKRMESGLAADLTKKIVRVS